MITTKDAINTMFHCIDHLNRQFPPNQKLVKAEDSILVGEGGVLDSLGLITLFVSLEQEVASRFAARCALLDTLMQEQAETHFRTIASTAQWITQNAAAA